MRFVFALYAVTILAGSLARYVVSSEFGNEILEKWQSEFLQFTLYILLTVWLVQRGSAESKPVNAPHASTDG